jgi:hypothetical protein
MFCYHLPQVRQVIKLLMDATFESEDEIEENCGWFEENGGYCDCEVHLNVIMREERWSA